MATDLGQQTKPTPKYETFVEQQLARARGRIRALDAAAIGLVLLLGTLAYCLTMTFLDRALDLSPGVRLAAFVVYACAAVLYLGWAGFRLLSRRINPYYAARQIEQALPDAKNSVVNWLDLRGANLPPVIRGALGQRAARDLKQADLDRAISTRRTTWLSGAVLTLLLVVLVLYVLGGGQFLSLLERAFAPFQEVAIATRTTLTLLQPEGGDAVLPVGRPIAFRVHVDGRVPRVNQPDALRLHYRYNPTDPYVEQGLEQDVDGEWTTALLADQVQNGLWYKVSGGDAETPEYQVRVRAQAQMGGFDVKYHYRPYRNRADRVVHYPNQDAVAPHLAAHRGTDVTLIARANRAVRDGRLEMDLGGVKKELLAERLIGQPDVLRFQFTLETSGTYRVLFTSTDGDTNTDLSPYRIEVLADRQPLVQLTKPGKDMELPAHGTLSLEGRAEDDFGITQMTLRLRVTDGPVLKAKAYRAGKSFRLDNGDYPDALDYKDYLALEKLQTDAGVPFALAPGMELKYWLEANDNCDYPDKTGNVGRSKEYAVKIIEASAKPQQQQQRQKAQQAQKQHEQRQDQKLQNQNEAAKAKADQQEAQGSDQQKGDGQAGTQAQKEFENKARQLENALKEKEKQDGSKGQAKGDNSSQPQEASTERDKEKTEPNPGAAKEKQPSGAEKTGTQKDQGKDEPPTNKGQAKDGGQPEAGKNQPQPQGQAKDGGKEKAGDKKGSAKTDGAGSKQGSEGPDAKGSGKEKPKGPMGQAKNGQQSAPGSTKDAGRDGASQTRAEGKDGGKASGAKQSASAKDDGKGNSGPSQQAPGDAKPAPQDQAAQAKDQQGSGEKPDASQAKGPGQPDAGKQQPAQAKSAAKDGASAASAAQQKASANKDAGSGGPPRAESKQAGPDKTSPAGMAKGDGASAGQKAANNSASSKDATKEDVANLKEALKSADQKRDAADKLSRISKEAQDPQVGKAAEDALKEAAAQAKAIAQEANKDDVARLKEALQGADQKQAAADELARIGKEARDPEVRKAAEDALREADSQAKGSTPSTDKKSTPANPGGSGESGNKDTAKNAPGDKTHAGGVPQSQGTGDFGDKYRQQAGNEDFARRGGVLQLEDLKKKVTPDILKKLNWTDKDWQQFQEQARQYEAARQKQQPLAGKDRLRPGSSLLPSTGPRQVGSAPDSRADDLSGGQALPPPEFREAQRIFISRPEGTPVVPGRN